MRGAVHNEVFNTDYYRITPAYAGSSPLSFIILPPKRDHPRVCGEQDNSLPCFFLHFGSPPRMRGAAITSLNLSQYVRITPAYAGSSLPRLPHPPSSQDHPRVCGEQKRWQRSLKNMTGSPPRMRGAGSVANVSPWKIRITPAYAGSRRLRGLPGRLLWDHPCVCGEQYRYRTNDQLKAGSPPRMRGAVRNHLLPLELAGITPAYAGSSSGWQP